MSHNPVERCLLKLCDHWSVFRSDPSKRLLIWQADANAIRFFQCFFEVQKHPTDYTVGDLFIVFDTPFQNTIQYSRELKESLAGQYEASRDDLIQQGIRPDWQFQPEAIPDSADGFVRSLKSFGSKHHERIGHLVAVLMPGDVADNDRFASWLTRILDTGCPERMRFVVIDSLETPRLNQLSASGNEQIRFDAPKIDSLTTAQETFAQESVAGPAGTFRNLLIGLMALVEKSSADAVKIKAADALKFACKQKWADQEVVIANLVAGAMLKEKRFSESLEGYQFARQAAKRATADGHPSGGQLELQTWFGEAGVHLAAGDLEKAVKCYDQAAVLSQQISNPILSIEAFRMAAFCLARMNEPEPAVQRGWNALKLGQSLKSDARAMTTLPFAAIDLLRVIDPRRVSGMEYIAYQKNTRLEAAQSKADKNALALGKNEDPVAFQTIEKALEKETTHIGLSSARQVDTLAGAGCESFREVFSTSRKMLGDNWPINTLAGVPANAQSIGDGAR